MNLYEVILRGMQNDYGSSYVVATDPTSAYNIVRKFLDDNDIGFSGDRELSKIALLAGTNRYNDTGKILYIALQER